MTTALPLTLQLMLLIGLYELAAGIAGLTHSHWTDVPAVIVSAVGWIVAAEGLLMMSYPNPLLAFSRNLVGNQRIISLLAAGLGIVLILIGFTGRAESA